MGISQEAAGVINDDAARRSFVSISQAKQILTSDQMRMLSSDENSELIDHSLHLIPCQ
jgi:hypothetical protein